MSDPSPTNAVFATPLYRVLTDISTRVPTIRDFFLERQTQEFRHPDSPQAAHASLFESRFDLFKWADPEIQTLKDVLYAHLMNYLKDVNGATEEQLQQLNFQHESWYHVTHKGGYFQSHNHPMASVSMIYCVDPGDEEIDDREAGCVMFNDPRAGASMYLDPANRHMQRLFSFNAIRFRLKPDELVIFPSYLLHNVEPYHGLRPRITLAANFSFAFKR